MTMVNRGTYVFAESDAAPANIPIVFNSQYFTVYVGQTINLCNYVSSPESFRTPSTHNPKIDREGWGRQFTNTHNHDTIPLGCGPVVAPNS